MFSNVVTRFGWKAGISYGIYRAIQRCIILECQHIMVLETANTTFTNDKCELPVIRSLDAHDIGNFSAESVNQLEPDCAREFNRNQRCFAALGGPNELLGYAWFAFKEIPAKHNRGFHPATSIGYRLPENLAFMYNAFVRPEYRGRKLYAQIILSAVQSLSSENISQVGCSVDWTNHGSLRGCRRAGFRSIGKVWRFGFPSRMFTVLPRAFKEYGFRRCHPSDSGPRDRQVTARIA